MKIHKLMTMNGSQIKNPEGFDGSVSFNANDGRAYGWASDGKTLIAEMKSARVVWIGPNGIRIEGMEPINTEETRFRAQAWQVNF